MWQKYTKISQFNNQELLQRHVDETQAKISQHDHFQSKEAGIVHAFQ
jgi:hypothetical protein